MNFFLDKNLSPKLVTGLRVVDPEHSFFHLAEKFSKGTPDEVWLRELSALIESPVVFTGNRGISQNKVLRGVLSRTGYTFFILDKTWMNLPWVEFSTGFLGAWPQMRDQAIEHPTSTLFRVKYGRHVVLENLSADSDSGGSTPDL